MFSKLEGEKLSSKNHEAHVFSYPGATANAINERFQSDGRKDTLNTNNVKSIVLMCGTKDVDSILNSPRSMRTKLARLRYKKENGKLVPTGKFYYMDETWINKNHHRGITWKRAVDMGTTPTKMAESTVSLWDMKVTWIFQQTGKGKRLIVLHFSKISELICFTALRCSFKLRLLSLSIWNSYD